jgi:hypothetical protein
MAWEGLLPLGSVQQLVLGVIASTQATLGTHVLLYAEAFVTWAQQ